MPQAIIQVLLAVHINIIVLYTVGWLLAVHIKHNCTVGWLVPKDNIFVIMCEMLTMMIDIDYNRETTSV